MTIADRLDDLAVKRDSPRLEQLALDVRITLALRRQSWQDVLLAALEAAMRDMEERGPFVRGKLHESALRHRRTGAS